MSLRDALTYRDRESGCLRHETVYAQGFLHWAYNTRSGRLVTDLVLRHRWVSRLYGWLHKQPFSRRRIRSFARQMNVNTDEMLRPLDDYTSFNDFFTRPIDLGERPVQADQRVCAAPADGRVLAYPRIETGERFRIKQSLFELGEFLGDDDLAAQYDGGAMCITRLYLSDYHRFHFPDSGIPEPAVSISGHYYAVSPYSLRRLVPVYAQNHRMLTRFHSDHFGEVMMVEVGAFTVGSIRQSYHSGKRVAKGELKGLFEVGGSTVVLIFEKGAIALDDDLCASTAEEVETYVQLGTSLGRAVGPEYGGGE